MVWPCSHSHRGNGILMDLSMKMTAVSIFFFILKLSFNLIKSIDNLYKCYLTYVGKPAQLCFDVMALRITGPGQDSTTGFS